MPPAEDSPIDALVQLLDAELDCVRKAEFDRLDGFTGRKEALLQALTSGPAPDASKLARLRQKARRNAEALDAARLGLQAARRRIAELVQSARPETYGADGRRLGLTPASSRIERRA